MEYVVLEVTSHGIDQNRVWGIRPTIAAITNVTHEHLDYHKTFENYLHTKAKLLLASSTAIINADAKDSFALLKSMLEAHKIEYLGVDVESLPTKIRQSVRARFGEQRYNFENSAIATQIAKLLEIPEKTIAQAIEKFPGVPGRMEEVTRKGGVRVIVDFAHTPNALEKALQALESKGRLIVVFGCAGLRDITKRPLMGEIATRLADLVVLTAEDPRTEDVWSIIAQIKSGVKTGHDKIVSIEDREEAISFALTQFAKSGDTVLISGKGHEKSMNIRGTEYPWSDQIAVKKILHL
jgi:UDP-N-acetylmuramoyl-L-alanyl-D-glutamate--2,6-diaminopimelate ligase